MSTDLPALTDADREAERFERSVDLASTVFGWQHLARYSGQTTDWLDQTLRAIVKSARSDYAAERALVERVEELAASDYVFAACVCGRGIARHANAVQTGWWHISRTFQIDHRAEPLAPAEVDRRG